MGPAEIMIPHGQALCYSCGAVDLGSVLNVVAEDTLNIRLDSLNIRLDTFNIRLDSLNIRLDPLNIR